MVMKRSLQSGFAGIDNPLYHKDNAQMLFGDAKQYTDAMVKEFGDSHG
jgi:NAD(P) transhydrogenase subunit beta